MLGSDVEIDARDHGRGLGATRAPAIGTRDEGSDPTWQPPRRRSSHRSHARAAAAGAVPRTRPQSRGGLLPLPRCRASILFTLAITLPAIIGIFFSFTNSIGFGDWEFVGFINYIAAFSDPAILQSYLFTFGFAAVTVVVVNAVAFLLAVGLTSRIRFKTGLRTIFVIPMVISGIVIAFVFNFLFSNSVPALGQALGIGWLSESILANPDLAWVAIVIVTAWQAIPGTLLIYIAGLLVDPRRGLRGGRHRRRRASSRSSPASRCRSSPATS